MKKYIVSLLVLLLLANFHSSAQSNDQAYQVGVVPQFDARRTVAIWSPILEILEKETGIKYELIIAKDIPTFEKALFAGKYHLAYMNPYHFLVASKKQGYIPLVKDTSKQLSGIIVVRKDSPIKKLEELNNLTIAYPAPNALGASLMPRAILANEYKIKTRPSFVKSHDSVYLNVVTGMASAGGGVMKTLNSQPEEIKANLRVLFTTSKVAPHPIAVHPKVAQGDFNKIKKAFNVMAQSKEGGLLLSRIPMKKAGEAFVEDYLPLQSLGLESFFVEG